MGGAGPRVESKKNEFSTKFVSAGRWTSKRLRGALNGHRLHGKNGVCVGLARTVARVSGGVVPSLFVRRKQFERPKSEIQLPSTIVVLRLSF